MSILVLLVWQSYHTKVKVVIIEETRYGVLWEFSVISWK